jgi:dTDP-D-glucose 4,6-dehydratase
VICFDSLEYCASLQNIISLTHLRNFRFVKGSICDVAAVEAVFQSFSVDAVVHFAANSHVDTSFEDPISFTQTNTVGTQILLETARKHGQVQRFLHVSTDEVYGENDPENLSAFKEEDVLRPTNPYSASKAAAEMIINAYRKSYRMPIITTRCNNVYGPHQYPESKSPKSHRG